MKQPLTAERVAEHFAVVDVDGNGQIDRAEFRALLVRLGIHRSDGLVDRVFQSIDTNASGSIDLDEFSRWWVSVDSG